MKWTVEQIDEMRLGRPIYGDRQTSGALTWLRTSQETNGEYLLGYGEASPGVSALSHAILRKHQGLGWNFCRKC
ncbi:hypothetical protein FB556_1173 [Enteractinococcus coprophilus]|uniref:Uncharacterized protein n=1 Tax=Enteractinococcus coprophilus TaxID=1027633 RepID=A0A543AIW1_9MICC|nr:hypothetical protein FB556_1173 [Enteractinococcus coprophilus]